MNNINFIVSLAVLLTCLSSSHAFFTSYTKKNADMRSGPNSSPANQPAPPPQWYREAFPPWQPFGYDAPGPVAVAVPIAVPMQAQLANGGHSTATLKGMLHPGLKLVPCLCPMSEEYQQQMQHQQMQNNQQQQQAQPTAYVVPVQAAPVQTSSSDMPKEGRREPRL